MNASIYIHPSPDVSIDVASWAEEAHVDEETKRHPGSCEIAH